MKTLNMLVLLIVVLAWAECAPYQRHDSVDYANLENPDDDSEQLHQTQEDEDILGSLQHQAHAEDLQQYQQEHIPQDLLSGHLQNFNQRAQEFQQAQENDAILDAGYLHQSQAANLERFPEQHGQLREVIPDSYDMQQSQTEDFHQDQQGLLPIASQSARIEDIGQDEHDVQQLQGHEAFLSEYEQQSQDAEKLEQGQIQDMGRLTDDTQQIQDHDSLIEDSQQQSQVEDFSQFQQGKINEQQSGRLEDLGDDADTFQQTQDKQIEDLREFPEQQGQIQNLGEVPISSDLQIQDHDSFVDDSQQHSQVEDFSQFQQGKINEQQSGRLEDLGDDADTFQQTQDKQIEDLREFPEQQGQIQDMGEVPISGDLQIQDHNSFVDDSQQQSQVEDFSQFQQGKINEQQSGRLEDLGDDADTFQQTQDKQIEDLREFPEQQGQIQDLGEVPISADLQIQDHDSFVDDSQQQSQVEDLSLFQQGKITNEQQSGRLEDLGDETIFQEHQEKQNEDLYQDQELGQIRQDAQEQNSAEFFDRSEQQTQLGGQNPYSVGQFHTEPKIPALQISQVRHEQLPYSYNKENEATEVESHDMGGSSMNIEPEQVPSVYGGELHQKPSDDAFNNEMIALSRDYHLTTHPAPGFWKRLGSKIESAYGKAKDKGQQIIHSIKESVG
ncbi:involucrin-like [Hetaerina americana]|uniref:involucrin-like n=1 Tax=Hetaerina americana TaxID=62018 RepID=UPI003A7F573F